MTQEDNDLEPFLAHPGLSRVRNDLARLAKNSIHISTTVATDESIPVGTSKFGGEADLPASIEWPTGTLDLSAFPPGLSDDVNSDLLEREGRYNLPFVAQFRLADVAPYDLEGILPSTGMLYFFYGDPGMHFGIRASQWFWSKHWSATLSPNYWKVIHYDGDLRKLNRVHAAQALPDNRPFGTCDLTFRSSTSLPQVETCFIGNEANKEASVVLMNEEWRIYAGLRYEQYSATTVHKLLGYSDDAQPYAMENSYSNIRDLLFPHPSPFEALTEVDQQEELVEGRLLLQLDSLPEIDMHFGRDGMLFFFIREQDLRARDFSRVWATEQ